MTPTYDWPWVETQVSRTSEAWRECSALPLPCAPQFTRDEQRRREAIYDRAVVAVERETAKMPGTAPDRAAVQNRLIKVFGNFAATALDLPGDAIDLITRDFVSLGADFARQARRFDRSLSMEDIFQACRNAWTAGGLQSLLGERPAVTPSVLGYSLLYPYSDNYMDSTRLTAASKLRFSERFRRRLRGEALAPETDRETAIWGCVALVEAQYPRPAFPQVYDCLLAIHRAQENSISQSRKAGRADEQELLGISFAKGGSSVLADACLVSGRLRESDAALAFDWGAVLQLGDDLQDVREDLHRGSQTLFTRAIQSGPTLDALAQQLLNFSEHVAIRMNQFPCGSAVLKDLLRTSWRSIILAAIASATDFFSPAFLDEIESGSPFRFEFLRSRNKRLARRNGLFAKLFDVIIDEPGAQRSAAPAPAYIPSPIDTNCRWSSSAR
ncbi:MAG TPA: hypothetical protein VGR47_02105 [Terracidiphilus sp.]|nr:hypothetical protein [Terracidiphilus sp.]